MAGLTLCQCLEALVLHRIIKMPNSCKRDPNLSLEKKKKKKKKSYFLYFTCNAGAQRDENFTVLGVTLSLEMSI